MLNIKRIFSLTIVLLVIFVGSINAQKLNQFDANGKRTGVWKKYYENNLVFLNFTLELRLRNQQLLKHIKQIPLQLNSIMS